MSYEVISEGRHECDLPSPPAPGGRHASRHVHILRLEHHRSGRAGSGSEVDVQAASNDLTEAWQELLSRLPNDVYAALKAAMHGIVELQPGERVAPRQSDPLRGYIEAINRRQETP